MRAIVGTFGAAGRLLAEWIGAGRKLQVRRQQVGGRFTGQQVRGSPGAVTSLAEVTCPGDTASA